MTKRADLTGRRYGKLTAVKYIGDRRWECKCDCGNVVAVRTSNLTSGHTTSCGCNKLLNDKRVGAKQGRLTILEYYFDDGRPWYRCRCDCGGEVTIRADSPTLSCGKCGAYVETRADALRSCGEYVGGTQISKLRSKPTAANVSGIVGVNWDKSRNKWQASIRFKGHKYNLGRFEHMQDAIDARQEAEKEIFGNFLEWYELYKAKKEDR